MSVVAAMKSTSVIRRWQIALIGVGVLLLVTGGLVLLADVSPGRYIGILIWFAGAIILHDGIIAPVVFGIGLLMRKAGRALPPRRLVTVLAILQGAIVVGAIVFLIVFPQIVKQGIGVPNPTVLPLDYSSNLIAFYVVLVLVTGAAIALYLLVAARRQKARSSITQD